MTDAPMRIDVSGDLVALTPKEIAQRELDAAPQPAPIPASASNFQARAVMRQFKMADGRSLFTTVDSDLRAAVDETRSLDEFDPERMQADLAWQAWEQANTYDRKGTITQLLAGRYGFDEATTDELFRKADKVTA